MATLISLRSLRLIILLIPIIAFTACSSTVLGDEFSFTAPSGFKTKQFITAADNPNNGTGLLIFSQKGHLYFQVLRQKITTGKDLSIIFNEHKTKTSEDYSNYQFISQDTIQTNNQSAIEYVYRGFHGEPYVQNREIWIEKSGWAYLLICTDPVDSTPGLTIPVSDLCIRLVEGFKFK